MQGSFDQHRDQPPDIAVERAVHLIAEAPIELTGRFLGNEEFSPEFVAGMLEKQKGLMRVT